MKPLENNILIYDCDCPMCNIYSGAFIKTGMMDQKGRMPYHLINAEVKELIDPNRSRNEIALVDVQQRKVIYGLDSLLTILGNNFPLIKIIFRFSPLYWCMKKIYFLISYNRKVIAPSKELDPPGACTPDYNVRYRLLFIVLSSFFVAWILNMYFGNISFIKYNSHHYLTEWCIAIGQLILQGILIAIYNKDKVLHYLGHNMVISMIGVLLLLPAIWFSGFMIAISEILYIGYFALPVSVMFWQHIRRIKILALPWGLTITWVLYRAMIAVGYLVLN